MMILGVSLPLTSESPMNFRLSTKKMNFTLKMLKSFFSDAASIISQGGGRLGGGRGIFGANNNNKPD